MTIATKLIDDAGLTGDMRAGVVPGLEVALASLADVQGLTTEGRAQAMAQFQGNLGRLAAIVADRKAHPEIADVVIDRPVFILGLPRCGTSMLHALIGADPLIRTPLSWEVAIPSPPPEAATFDTDARADAFDGYVDANFSGKWADVKKAHPIGARIPQECGMILESAFQGINPAMMFSVPAFYQWYRSADTSFGYRVHKMWLQHLAWRNPRARWVLKVQEHAYHLPELLSAYPDAMFVQPHRDPVTVLASISRLIEVIRSVAFAQQDRAALGEELLHLWNDGQVASMAARQARPALPILDIGYRALVADPVAMARRIYDFAGIEWTTTGEAAMHRWLVDNPAGKHGAHRYELGDFGLTEDRVRSVYADYIAAYADHI
ncbi:sulfotransferase [Sphingomonas sp. 28-63-12]|uniref:sulfotransferase family protein n=1 Tax=Sphingomonas sp. 28-63-12 TaxID=1970434 RepID=UPI000BCAAAF6|nr:MAG: sulfotransferase family protein [Sphingomonas sp. 28-63-12]